MRASDALAERIVDAFEANVGAGRRSAILELSVDVPAVEWIPALQAAGPRLPVAASWYLLASAFSTEEHDAVMQGRAPGDFGMCSRSSTRSWASTTWMSG